MNAPTRILVVDDDASMLRTVERVLRSTYDIVTASSPTEALERAAGTRPYIAILDIRMPEMDGFELMGALKELDPDIRVILMTGGVYDIDEQLIRAIREEAFYYITKPFDRDVLKALVKRCIEVRYLEDENRRHVLDLQEALKKLQTAQDQLIQAEKMASLGRLAGGIAHEVKNPLNFVNNFSVMLVEMVDELDALSQEIIDGRSINLLEDFQDVLSEIRGNSKRIEQHGKRADGIISNVLEHFRSKPGLRQSTDIHLLLDESIQLAYNSMRAVDEAFFTTIEKGYDELAGRLDIVTQDMSRAFFNFFDNAFYSIHKRQATKSDDYRPLLSVHTKKRNGQFEIEITDNGTGIAPDIQDKIFEPFFTTKPTGTGTGLGLSICYSVITHGHDGGVRVDSTEGEGATFIVTLPLGSD